MGLRNYSNTTPIAVLSSAVSNADTSFPTNQDVALYPAVPFTMIVEPDTVNEEVVTVTAKSGTTFTVTRGVDGTTAVAHASSASLIHGVSAQDFREANNHNPFLLMGA